MPKFSIDPVIHGPNWLQICALLSSVKEAEFAVLREELSVSDSVLSKHIKQLEDAGYIEIRAGKLNGRQHKWARLTRKGRAAFKSHLAKLTRLARLANSGAS